MINADTGRPNQLISGCVGGEEDRLVPIVDHMISDVIALSTGIRYLAGSDLRDRLDPDAERALLRKLDALRDARGQAEISSHYVIVG